jgi:hypothetical protein
MSTPLSAVSVLSHASSEVDTSALKQASGFKMKSEFLATKSPIPSKEQAFILSDHSLCP